jgi:hypothetical protein
MKRRRRGSKPDVCSRPPAPAPLPQVHRLGRSHFFKTLNIGDSVRVKSMISSPVTVLIS